MTPQRHIESIEGQIRQLQAELKVEQQKAKDEHEKAVQLRLVALLALLAKLQRVAPEELGHVLRDGGYIPQEPAEEQQIETDIQQFEREMTELERDAHETWSHVLEKAGYRCVEFGVL